MSFASSEEYDSGATEIWKSITFWYTDGAKTDKWIVVGVDGPIVAVLRLGDRAFKRVKFLK